MCMPRSDCFYDCTCEAHALFGKGVVMKTNIKNPSKLSDNDGRKRIYEMSNKSFYCLFSNDRTGNKI